MSIKNTVVTLCINIVKDLLNKFDGVIFIDSDCIVSKNCPNLFFTC